MKLDILAFAAHPDDAELACSGTLLMHLKKGYKVGIADLTKGELGTRGTPQIRAVESEEATKIMGLHVRENLGLADGFFENSKESKLEIVKILRKYQPEIVLCNAVDDRHPDHGRGGKVVSEACFLSGLRMIETTASSGEMQQPWRPKNVYHYIQDRYIHPDFIIDISEVWDQKVQAIQAFKSQFFNSESNSTEPQTYISTPEFMQYIEARAREFGHQIGTGFGEGFTKEKQLGLSNLFDLI